MNQHPSNKKQESGPYEFIEKVKTLRELPNIHHSKDTVAIKIPNGDKESPEVANIITYRQLHDLIEDTASALVRIAGIEEGDVVSIPLPNTVEYVLSFLAVPWARGVSAPLNPNYTEKEYAFYMEDNKSKCVLVPKEGLPAAEAAAKGLRIPVYMVGWTAGGTDGGGGSVRVECKYDKEGTVAETMNGNSSETQKDKLIFAPDPDDVALFLHTSGTTARPKVSNCTRKTRLHLIIAIETVNIV